MFVHRRRAHITAALILSAAVLVAWNTSSSSDINQDNVSFSASSSLTLTSASQTIPSFFVDCGAGTGFQAHHKNEHPLSAPIEQTFDSVPTGCQLTYNFGLSATNNKLWRMGYDSLKKFIENCPMWPESWRAFDLMSQDAQQLSGRDTAIMWEFSDWLKSVLYLNTQDPEYFCACLEVMPVRAPFDTLPGAASRRTNVGLSILYWMIQNTTCDTGYLWHQYESSRESQKDEWLNDTSAYKLDTTLTSMHDLGLDTLLAKHFQYAAAPEQPFTSIVPEYNLSQNPFDNSTTLHFTLAQTCYAKVDVLDVLGREVWAEGDVRLLEPGRHTVPIELPNSPAGTYYLRLTLGTGEVRTIKTVKE